MPCSYYSCTIAGCTAFITKISLAGGKCMSVIMCTFHLSCHTRAVTTPLTPVFTSSHFNFIFCPKFLCINFLFGPTVPQQSLYVNHQSSDNAGDEMMMSMYSLCPMFSILAAHSVTVAWLAVTEGVCLNAQSNCTCITYNQKAWRLLSQTMYLQYVPLENDTNLEKHNNCKNH